MNIVDVEISGPGGFQILPGLEYTKKLEQQINYLASLGLIVVATFVNEVTYVD